VSEDSGSECWAPKTGRSEERFLDCAGRQLPPSPKGLRVNPSTEVLRVNRSGVEKQRRRSAKQRQDAA
jgi:hypothetical protein